MLHRDLKIETTVTPHVLSSIDLSECNANELATAVSASLPHSAIQPLRSPMTSSIPLVVCTQALQGKIYTSCIARAMALFSAQELGYAHTYDDIERGTGLLPLSVTNGPQLAEWLIDNVNLYYMDAVTLPVRADGEENINYDPSHKTTIPMVEFSAFSLNQAYLRLVAALADLDDSGGTHDCVGHVAAATFDAVVPAGVQFIHLEDDMRISSCFVTFQQLVEDAHRWVMF